LTFFFLSYPSIYCRDRVTHCAHLLRYFAICPSYQNHAPILNRRHD
jgi:hypothetical protein